jgi:hypothetical protein
MISKFATGFKDNPCPIKYNNILRVPSQYVLKYNYFNKALPYICRLGGNENVRNHSKMGRG